MNYQSKQEEKRRLKKLHNESGGWPAGAYEKEKPNKGTHLVRFWKSCGRNSCWAWNKRYSRRYIRHKYKNKDYDIPSYKVYDLWWNVW